MRCVNQALRSAGAARAAASAAYGFTLALAQGWLAPPSSWPSRSCGSGSCGASPAARRPLAAPDRPARTTEPASDGGSDGAAELEAAGWPGAEGAGRAACGSAAAAAESPGEGGSLGALACCVCAAAAELGPWPSPRRAGGRPGATSGRRTLAKVEMGAGDTVSSCVWKGQAGRGRVRGGRRGTKKPRCVGAVGVQRAHGRGRRRGGAGGWGGRRMWMLLALETCSWKAGVTQAPEGLEMPEGWGGGGQRRAGLRESQSCRRLRPRCRRTGASRPA
jgi:hypothetical protein